MSTPGRRARDGLECHGWEPYDQAQFARLLAAAMAAGPIAPSFFDAGCGRGDRLVQALEAGCASAGGVEHDPELAGIARARGLTVAVADVREYGWYSQADIVYVNCPFVRDEDEAAFEHWLHDQVRPRGVLIQVNDTVSPEGWETVLDEREAWRGVWVRPL